MKENPVKDHIRLDAANRGIELWRNNVGVLKDINGRPVRYGLCNDSKQLNQAIKSSDLIGITPVVITPDMVGFCLGVFTAIECKKSDWSYSENDERAVAQKKFHDIVRNAGGMAGFATSVEDYRGIVRR